LGVGGVGVGGCIWRRFGAAGEANGEVVLGWFGTSGQFDVRFVFGGEGRKIVDFDGVGVDDSETEAIGREGEVLSGPLDGGAVGAKELFAGAGLVNDDALRANLVSADGLVGDY
jgi:hypothetical protein